MLNAFGHIRWWRELLHAAAFSSSFGLFGLCAGIYACHPSSMSPVPSTHDPALQAQCPTLRWSTPQAILPTQRSERPVARFPSLATGAHRNFVVGNDIMLFDGSAVPVSPFAAVAVGEKNLGKPEGRFSFIMPRAFADEVGRLHVVWGEPASAPAAISSLDWPPEPITSLWTSVYEESKGWTKPEQLVAHPSIRWGDASSAQRAPLRSHHSSGAEDIQWALVIPTAGGDPNQPIFVLRLRADGWRTASVSTEGLGTVIYPSIAIDSPRATLAFIAAHVGTAHDRNSVFVRHSTDSGDHWGPASIVSLSGTRPAHETRVLHGAGATVHLVWLQGDASNGVSVVRHVQSADHGGTWSSPADLGPPALRQSLRATVDKCETLHVVVENLDGGADARVLEYATWVGTWSALSRPFPSLVAVGPDLRVGTRGLPLVAFLARQSDVPPTSVMKTVYSELSPQR